MAAACEILGLDPLYVANEGVFIAIVESAVAPRVVEKLNQLDPAGKPSIIGKVVNQHPRQVVFNSTIGGRRVVNMLAGEQLPRIC